MHHLTTLQQALALAIGVLSVARTARLLAHDSWPPTVRARIWWDNHVRGGWNPLLHCQFCLTPWMAAGMALWFWLGGEHWTWWVINGVWGFSYISAILVSWDQPPEVVINNHND